MAKEIPSVGDLRRNSEVTDGKIDAGRCRGLTLTKHGAAPRFVLRCNIIGYAWLIRSYPRIAA
jgi:hypothetical protein